MYQVAICDDHLQCIEEIKSCIPKEYKVDTFLSGKEFLDKNEENPYDIVFMDIEMPDLNGLEVAEKLVKVLDNRILIFVSSHEDYAIQAIRLSPFRYVRKHCLQEDMEEALEAAEQRLQQLRVKCVLQTETRCEEFRLYNVLYAEIKNHTITVHMQDGRGDLDIRMSMDELVAQMNAETVIVRTHKSYIVNLHHVCGEDGKEVILDNGMRIPLSRGFRGVFLKKYMDFVRN